MRWIYLSPHFDDVVLSCGGLVWEQVRAGQQVEVWTICAGAPEPGAELSDFAQSLHVRWETGPEAVPTRRAEDEQALRLLGASARYWHLPDAIYRQLPGGDWLVNDNDGLWQPVHPAEQGIVEQLAGWIHEGIGQDDAPADTRLVSPLTLGNHVDHSVVRAAAEHATSKYAASKQAAKKLVDIKPAAKKPGAEPMAPGLWYYPDYPYATNPETSWTGKAGEDWQKTCHSVSREALAAWQAAVACYASQLSTFWPTRAELDAALEDYWRAGGGKCLWLPGT